MWHLLNGTLKTNFVFIGGRGMSNISELYFIQPSIFQKIGSQKKRDL